MKAKPKTFQFDTLLDEGDICNHQTEINMIRAAISDGLKVLVYGRRNFGKTSVIKNVIAKQWCQNNPDGFYFYVDLMGVTTLRQISERMTLAFADAYNRSFKARAMFEAFLKTITKLRPSIEVDDDGTPKISLSLGSKSDTTTHFFDVIKHIGDIAERVNALIVLDEFQDIYGVDEAQALLRNALQNLPNQVPVIILGSKQHLLSMMFSRPRAPFANWGTHCAFGNIPYQEYCDYMNERFAPGGLTIAFEESKYLQDRMARNPEAINRLCHRLLRLEWSQQDISKTMINQALDDLVISRSTEPEKYLSFFSIPEQKVITAIAKEEPVKQIQSKSFANLVQLTQAAIGRIVKRLENEAVLYREADGYVLADPLLRCHVLRYRLLE
jgi:AAA+ ATPase superfamily predicted ATPase